MRLNLKVFRVKHNKKQCELAEMLGIDRSNYSMIEQGKRNGSLTFWNKLQETFDIPENEMWSLMKNEEE